jgi:hypothetical protein
MSRAKNILKSLKEKYYVFYKLEKSDKWYRGSGARGASSKEGADKLIGTLTNKKIGKIFTTIEAESLDSAEKQLD